MGAEIENAVLIVVDALRNDRVGAYSDCDLTPNIDALAEEGEIFESSYACINTTDPSITTILSGQYPTRHGVLNHADRVTEREMRFAAGIETLPQKLRSGFDTLAIDTLERWHERGFDTYINPRESDPSQLRHVASRIARMFPSFVERAAQDAHSRIIANLHRPPDSGEITAEAISLIDFTDRQFFLFVHYWDTHIPYIPLDDHPDKLRNRTYDHDETLQEMLDSIRESQWAEQLEWLAGEATTASEMVRKYDAGVLKVDRAIGRLVDHLKKLGVYDETAIVITADHGESFTEHGIYFDHHGLYDPTVRVPLIIKAPGFEGREDQFVQHFDIVPTVLDVLGEEYEDDRFEGVSLADHGGTRNLDREAVYMEEAHTVRRRAVRTKSHKFIFTVEGSNECRYCGITHGPSEELFDIETDPGERRNIVDDEPQLKTKLEDRIHFWIGDLPDPVEQDSSFEVSGELEEHLEEMGYL